MTDQVRAALAPLPAAYHTLFDRVVDQAKSDERIRALWLSGSLARGVADAGSDLDVIVAVSDDVFDEFARGWRDWLAAITPTAIARPLPGAPGSFYSTTVDGSRLDVVAEPVGRVGTHHRQRLVVFDRDNLDSTVPQPDPPPGPDTDRIRDLIEEFFRQQAIFPAAVLAREDWLLGVEGVHNARLMLYQLFVESNQPLPPMGVKQWSAKLTAGQRDLLRTLPPTAATPESVIAGMRASRDAFCTAGRAAAAGCGVEWPEDLQRLTQNCAGGDLAG